MPILYQIRQQQVTSYVYGSKLRLFKFICVFFIPCFSTYFAPFISFFSSLNRVSLALSLSPSYSILLSYPFAHSFVTIYVCSVHKPEQTLSYTFTHNIYLHRFHRMQHEERKCFGFQLKMWIKRLRAHTHNRFSIIETKNRLAPITYIRATTANRSNNKSSGNNNNRSSNSSNNNKR